MRQIDVIGSFAGLARTTSDGTHIGGYARTLLETQPEHQFYESVPFVGRMLAIVDRQSPTRYGQKQDIGTLLRESGALSTDPRDRQPHLFNLFYTFANLHNDHHGVKYTSNYPKDTLPAFREFPFKDELLAEYKKSADYRFGDGLLAACELYERDQMKQAA